MSERVRICDIAEELGLSTATVSNVIHGKTGKVSAETVERVTALLEEREYIPSMAGIRVPEDISVAGFDDTPICEMLRPALTTVRQDGALPFDTLRTLAAEKFGVTLTETDIGGSLDVRDGKLFVVAEDAQPNMLYNYVVTDVQESGDGTDVTVQFFADCNGFFKSHEVVYTVGQDGALRAGLAVEKLRELKEGLPVETEIMLPVSLVVRNSTAPRRG